MRAAQNPLAFIPARRYLALFPRERDIMHPRTALAAIILAAIPVHSVRGEIIMSSTQGSGASLQGYTPTLGYPMWVGGFQPTVGITRGAFEYSLTAAPEHFEITLLSFRIRTTFPMSIPFQSIAYAYPGDGEITPGDFLQTTASFAALPSIEVPGFYNVTIQNLFALNSAMGWGASRHLGIMLHPTFGGTAIDADHILILWNPIPAPATLPFLLTLFALPRRRERAGSGGHTSRPNAGGSHRVIAASS
jgi:hypothetical protein